ncbi:MAG: prolipoprotein diacylglyceryl transferase [Pseudomonadota bacterium]|jgi:phosphatidylglycerol:prolipoprotein diacylglycerol transferase
MSAILLSPLGLVLILLYAGENFRGKALIHLIAANATAYVQFENLGLDPVALNLGFFTLKWYSLAYLAGILVGYWYLLKLIAQPGSPMARRHADDMIFYATLGIIIGGRLAYVIFYQPAIFAHPLDILKLWNGGMSFHGGVLGVTCGIIYLSRREGLNWLRVHDFVACCVPFGLFFGRLANFVNGELWGKVTDVPWAIIFPTGGPDPRHPSQLYEAVLEGPVLFAVLAFMFWKTAARYQPGKLVGTFLLGYGLARFFVEFFREADAQLMEFAQETGLHMGQWLTLPMIIGGLYLILTAKGRRQRIEATAGSASVA